MRTTTLGKTGLRVSRIGFGGIPIQRVSEEEAVQVVHRCIELGVTLLDTANAYTNSEARIGKALAVLPGQREQLVIATKTAARDRATAWQHLGQSLRDLGLDVIDLWQLHNVSSIDSYEQVLAPGGALEAAQEARRAGLIRHIGISSHSMEVALQAVSSGHFETLQFPFNFVTREPAENGLTDLDPLIEFGASPRASIYLIMAARAHAFLHGRGFVTPEDIKQIAPDVLRHRIVISYEAEAEEINSAAIVQRILDQIEVP
jgi:aryl-alcohol dehydrogenase-like predicted oxidoreductase